MTDRGRNIRVRKNRTKKKKEKGIKKKKNNKRVESSSYVRIQTERKKTTKSELESTVETKKKGAFVSFQFFFSIHKIKQDLPSILCKAVSHIKSLSLISLAVNSSNLTFAWPRRAK